MIGILEGSLSAAVVGGTAYYWSRRTKARRHQIRELARARGEIIRGHEPRIAAPPPTSDLREHFLREPMIRVADFLAPESLTKLQAEAFAVAGSKTRSYIPTHKKGGTVGYETLHRSCPGCLAFYHSPAVKEWVALLVGQTVGAAGDHDQSANSLLYYDEADDHINWHYDHNFYKGRQFTALLNLVNRGSAGGVSASKLAYRSKHVGEVEVETCENSFVVFEGATILHRATPTAAGDLRIMLSMTFSTDARISLIGEALRRVKDTAFFGLRVLWT